LPGEAGNRLPRRKSGGRSLAVAGLLAVALALGLAEGKRSCRLPAARAAEAGEAPRVAEVTHTPLAPGKARFTPRPFPVAGPCRMITNPDLPVKPVSIWHWSGDEFLVCNYLNVYLVNAATGSAVVLEKPPDVSTWVPTGVCADPNSGHILVANYNGHDVLEMVPEGGRLKLVNRYTHPDMHSPETVCLTQDGTRFAVADYDGDAVFFFARGGKMLWRREARLAHGLCIVGEVVYATSLRDRTLLKFDTAGNLLAKAGKLGWGDNKYLWPVGMAAAGDDIVVCDAHTGKISFLTPSLAVTKWFGGNGPRFDLFNMPFCACVHDGKMLVGDAFKHRILVIEQGTCTAALSHDPVPEGRPAAPPRDKHYLAYVNQASDTRVTIPGLTASSWHDAYAGYVRADTAGQLYYPRWGTLFAPAGSIQPYFCWSTYRTRHGSPLLLLGHSQGVFALVVDQDGRATPVAGGYLWPEAGELVDNYGAARDLDGLLDVALRRFRRQDTLLRHGTDPLEAVRLAYWPSEDGAGFAARVRHVFVTRPGKRFFAAFERDQTPEGLREARDAFRQALAREGEVELQEIFLVNMLTRGLGLDKPTLAQARPPVPGGRPGPGRVH
jgi:hypothetical protein